MIIRFNDDKTLDFIDGVTELNENDLFYHNIKVELESSLSSTLDTLWIVFKNAIGEITKPVLLAFDKNYYTTSIPNEVINTPGECEIQILIRRTSTTNSSKYIIQRASFTYKITIQEGLTVEGEKITAYDLISLYETAKTAIDSIVNLNVENGTGENSIQQKGATANGNNARANGNGNIASGENQAVDGAFNEEDLEAVYIVGNGENDNKRSNAFVVKKDGRVKVQTAPTESDDVVRKEELDKKIVFVDIENLIANSEYNKFLELSRQMSIGETIAVVKIDDKITTIQNVYYNDKTNTAIWSAIISSEMNIVTLVTIELINNVINWGVKDYNLSQLSSKITQLNSSKQDKLSFDGEYDRDSNKVATVSTVTKTISDKLSEVVANAPESFDTLKEIADWIEEHPESVAELNSQIQANKQAIEELKESPALIEIPYNSSLDTATKEDINQNPYKYCITNGSTKYYFMGDYNNQKFFCSINLTNDYRVELIGYQLTNGSSLTRVAKNFYKVPSITTSTTAGQIIQVNSSKNGFELIDNPLPKPSTENAGKVLAVKSDGSGYEAVEVSGGAKEIVSIDLDNLEEYNVESFKTIVERQIAGEIIVVGTQGGAISVVFTNAISTQNIPSEIDMLYGLMGIMLLPFGENLGETRGFDCRALYINSNNELVFDSWNIYGTGNPFPEPTQENAGKVLGVNSIGNYALLDVSGNGGGAKEIVTVDLTELIETQNIEYFKQLCQRLANGEIIVIGVLKLYDSDGYLLATRTIMPDTSLQVNTPAQNYYDMRYLHFGDSSDWWEIEYGGIIIENGELKTYQNKMYCINRPVEEAPDDYGYALSTIQENGATLHALGWTKFATEERVQELINGTWEEEY